MPKKIGAGGKPQDYNPDGTYGAGKTGNSKKREKNEHQRMLKLKKSFAEYRNKIKNNPTPQVNDSKIESKPKYSINGIEYQLIKKSVEFIFHGDDGVHNATAYETKDGMNFVWDSDGNESLQFISPTQAIGVFYNLPKSLRALSQKTIAFVNYSNPDDAYWQQTYQDFTRSLATSGEEITFYQNGGVSDETLRDVYIHEIAHNIDIDLLGGERFSESSAYADIMSADNKLNSLISPTLYGRNSPTEDFAESITMYYTARDVMEKYFPNRTKFIKSILGD